MSLPLRIKIEVIILKGNKVCVTKTVLEDGYTFYGFPGGGVEDKDSYEETAKKECLEEVGIAIKDVHYLGLNVILAPTFVKEGRAEKFSGINKYTYVATYDKMDKSLHGSEGDALTYQWLTIDEAIHKVSDNRLKAVVDNRIEALNKIKGLITHNTLKDLK